MKRGNRRYIHALALLVFLCSLMLAGGCSGPSFSVATYSLGTKPKATETIVGTVTSEQAKKHADYILEKLNSDGKQFSYRVVSEEDIVVVNTTKEGHRKIKEALDGLQ